MEEREERRRKALKDLCDVVTEAKLDTQDTLTLVIEFIYSIGASLESEYDLQSSEAVLMSYAEKPSIGNALMAQALWMRDNWKRQERKEDEQLRGKTETREGTNPVQDIQGDKWKVWCAEDEPQEGME